MAYSTRSTRVSFQPDTSIRTLDVKPVAETPQISLDEAKMFLKQGHKETLKDRHYGDREVSWTLNGKVIASGYFGHGGTDITVYKDGKETKFSGQLAYELDRCFLTSHIEFQGEKE